MFSFASLALGAVMHHLTPAALGRTLSPLLFLYMDRSMRCFSHNILLRRYLWVLEGQFLPSCFIVLDRLFFPELTTLFLTWIKFWHSMTTNPTRWRFFHWSNTFKNVCHLFCLPWPFSSCYMLTDFRRTVRSATGLVISFSPIPF